MTDAHTIGTEVLESFQLPGPQCLLSQLLYGLQIGMEGRLLGVPLHPEEIEGKQASSWIMYEKVKENSQF